MNVRGVVVGAMALAGAAGAAAVSGASVPAASGPVPPRGALSALSGPGACLGTGRHCGRLRGPAALLRIAVSGDGRNVYLTGQSGGLAILARDRRTGRLRQLRGRAGCFRRDGRQGCVRLAPLSDPGAVVVSRDGRSVYVTTTHGILVFARDRATGVLRAVSGPGGCVDAVRVACRPLRGVSRPAELLAAGDRVLYAAGSVPDGRRGGVGVGGLATLRRDPVTGALTQLPGPAGCANTGGVQGCAAVPCLHTLLSLARSGDGRHVYVGSTDSLDPELTSPGSVDTLASAGSTGALSFVGCATQRSAVSDLVTVPRSGSVLAATLFGNRGTGRGAAAIDLYAPSPSGQLVRRRQLLCLGARCRERIDIGEGRLAISPRGDTVYDGVFFSGVAALRRDRRGLTPLAGRWGCLVSRRHFMPPARCTRAGEEVGLDIALAPDGRNLYVGTLGNGSGSFYAGGIETFAVAR